MLIADSHRLSILKYSPSGQFKGFLDLPHTGTAPTAIQKNSDGYILGNLDGSFTLLRKDFSIRSITAPRELSSKGRIDKIFDWIPVGSDDIVVFSDAVDNDKNWKSGFYRIDPRDPRFLDDIFPVDSKDSARRFYQIGYPLMAGIGNKAYALVMESSPYIIEAGLSWRKISSFPHEFGTAPKLEVVTKTNQAQIFKFITTQSTATGLISYGRHLYVLTRRPNGSGTEWNLWEVDPCTDKIKKRIPINTRADHLLVVPGPDYWAFLEKGPVYEGPRQETSTVLMVPSRSIIGSRTVVAEGCPEYLQAPLVQHKTSSENISLQSTVRIKD